MGCQVSGMSKSKIQNLKSKIANPKSKVGLLGGTFDPPHIGHLLLGETARVRLGLDRVVFLPAGQPPHKLDRKISPAHDRLAMTQLAIAGNPHFSVDTTDIDRPAPHYTSTLLPIMHSNYPNSELWLLIGGDSLRDLPDWHEPQEVLRMCQLGVLPRPGVNINWEYLLHELGDLSGRVEMLDGPTIAVSSTHIRANAPAGKSLRYLTPPSVINYLIKKSLYTE